MLSQRKYALQLLQETRLLVCKLEATLIDNSKMLTGAIKYIKLVSKLIYLAISYVQQLADILTEGFSWKIFCYVLSWAYLECAPTGHV